MSVYFHNQYLFMILGGLILISGAITIIANNSVHSVFYLIFVFVSASAMLILLDVEFLAIIFLIVYVGAVYILFLFVVMMFNIQLVEFNENITRFISIDITVVFLWQSTIENFSNINVVSIDPWFSDTHSLFYLILYLGTTDYQVLFATAALTLDEITQIKLFLAFYESIAVKIPKVPLHVYYSYKDLFGAVLFFIFFATFVFYFPNLLGHSDNYLKADPLITPAHIQPEWYFLLFYIIFRATLNKLLKVIAMVAAILILLIMPFIHISKSILVMQPLASTFSTSAITKALLYFQLHPYCIHFVSSAFSIYTFFLQLFCYYLLLAVSTFVTVFFIFFIS